MATAAAWYHKSPAPRAAVPLAWAAYKTAPDRVTVPTVAQRAPAPLADDDCDKIILRLRAAVLVAWPV